MFVQYHSVFSVTGEFMIRQGKDKLMLYGKNQFGEQWQPQLFDLAADPWGEKKKKTTATSSAFRPFR